MLPLSAEELHGRTTNRLNEAKLDIRAKGFWNRDQQAFFDIRVFDPNACRCLNKSQQQCHAMKEHGKKRWYNEYTNQSTDMQCKIKCLLSIWVERSL